MASNTRFSQFLVKNLLLALLSLLLGFISWSYLRNKVEGERRITLTLEYKIPANSKFAPQPTIEVINADGTRKTLDKIEVEVRINGLKDRVSALDERALKLQSTVNPERDDYPAFQVDPSKMLIGADGLTAQIVNPQTYHLNFARLFATPVTIRLEYNKEMFEPGGKYYEEWVVRSYSLMPDRITVTGREDQLHVPADHHLFLSTRKVVLEPIDVKTGVWKRDDKVELGDEVEELDAQNQHVRSIRVRPEAAEVTYEVSVETRPETGSIKIPLQVLPPVDRLKVGATDAFDTYVLAEGSPREITVQYSKQLKTPAPDSTQIFAFVNVSAPGNLTNLPINLYSVFATGPDSRTKVWLAPGADGGAPHANVKLIPADVGTTVAVQGPFTIRPVFALQADPRYQVQISPPALENLIAHGSFQKLGGRKIGNDEIKLMVKIPQEAFSGREYDKEEDLLIVRPDDVTLLTDANGKPLPKVRVKLIPPALVPEIKPQAIGDVTVEIQYPPNFQMRLQLAQTKLAVSAIGDKDKIDHLRPLDLVVVVRPAADDDRPEFSGKARVIGVFRKTINSDNKMTGMETVPDVQFIPAEKNVDFKTEKAANGPGTNLTTPEEMFQPNPTPDSNKKLPPPPAYGS